MRAVNLLPSGSESRKSFRREDPAVVIGSALGAVVLVALGVGFMNVHAKVNAEQQKLTTARTELAKLSLTKKPTIVSKPVVTQPIVPIPAVTSEEQPRLAAITSALSTRIAWDRILREFSLVLPSDVTITSLTLTAPAAPVAAVAGAAPAPAASQGLSISGTAFSHDGVARLLSRLMLIPDLTNVMLSSSAGATGSAGVQFSISAAVKGAPALPALPAPVVPATTDTTTGASS
ncbi:MAG TPA: PilN domain-containing protein [Gaiellaceae bacterium]